jgi:hypothetical protein
MEEIHFTLQQEYYTFHHREFSVSLSLFILPLLLLFFLLYFFFSLSSFLSSLVRVSERGFPLVQIFQTRSLTLTGSYLMHPGFFYWSIAARAES